MIKKCLICNNEFKTFPCRQAKYCSHSCSASGTKNSPFVKGHIDYVTPEGRKKQARRMRNYRGENCWNWKGDAISVKSIHNWLNRTFGSACNYKCELCNKKAKDWSSKNHTYKRDREEFWTLCRSCHQLYDFKMGFRS